MESIETLSEERIQDLLITATETEFLKLEWLDLQHVPISGIWMLYLLIKSEGVLAHVTSLLLSSHKLAQRTQKT